MKRWAITRTETDELIMIYEGDFMDAMEFLSKNYEDGDADVEPYETWIER